MRAVPSSETSTLPDVPLMTACSTTWCQLPEGMPVALVVVTPPTLLRSASFPVWLRYRLMIEPPLLPRNPIRFADVERLTT